MPLVAWDEVGHKVTIPGWKSTISEYPKIVSNITPELLPDLIPKLGQLGAEIRDPAGWILTGQQRVQAVADVLGIAVQLALLEKSWELVDLPGVFYLKREEQTVVPKAEVNDVLNGTTTREAWVARCAELGITQVALSSLGEKPAA